MVAHDGLGAHVHGKDLAQEMNPLDDPAPPMGEIPPGQCIQSAQELPPHTPGNQVVVGRGIQLDQRFAGQGHDADLNGFNVMLSSRAVTGDGK